MSKFHLGEAIPAGTPHAISVCLPTWKDNIGYEELEERVITKMVTGYPRFFINKLVVVFAKAILRKHGNLESQNAMLFPSSEAAQRCIEFIISRDNSIPRGDLHLIDLVLNPNKINQVKLRDFSPSISAVLFPISVFSIAKEFWQHTGEGISSRRAEFCHYLFQEDILTNKLTLKTYSDGDQKACIDPKRYQKEQTTIQTDNPNPNLLAYQFEVARDSNPDVHESSRFIEERFGRNLDVSLSGFAKLAIRRRIAGFITDEYLSVTEKQQNDLKNCRLLGLTENDVYLWPFGMNAIFNTHKMLMEARGPMKSISFGFPYVDTLKILEKFGPGCIFYGYGSSEDLDDLEKRLRAGERYLALFCEFPGNPLLRSPDLLRIRELANTYDFAVVVDETIGNFINVNVLPYTDIVVSSLTKIFSGECNVTGGSSIINPNGRYYDSLKKIADRDYKDMYWPEDAIFMERNSRDFVARIKKINENAEALCDLLTRHPLVKTVYYPKCSPSKKNYDACRTPDGGYGGLLSFRLQSLEQAIAFHDHIEMAKGPSLGTNFTLVSPYVILAHYFEQEWAAKFGVHTDFIRVSVGLEDTKELITKFENSLKHASSIN
ncbi:Cystathionine gamma-synthase [Erysiphe neolycopersici]|uniref:cystathionine gamma-synthase n=1 Tax=Erysiphe neolycopersici TaxID=212602 RepID=A0A420HX52_9PEZI|nr:Cystathionine gamma-synthase [Erysiphe neolycopersici]